MAKETRLFLGYFFFKSRGRAGRGMTIWKIGYARREMIPYFLGSVENHELALLVMIYQVLYVNYIYRLPLWGVAIISSPYHDHIMTIS